MSKKRILVTGASGFLGWNLLRRPWRDCEWIACSHRHSPELPGVDPVRTDLTTPHAITELLDATHPDVVLHAAAVTNLNVCEDDPTVTRRINTDVPTLLARACAARGIRLIFTSTDMVFDGRHPPYAEDTPPCPINAYGRQKADAEAQILAHCPQAAICRMPLMFGAAGPHAHNFLPEWIGKLQQGQPIPLFTDEYRNPASAAVALEGLRAVIEQDLSGIIHLGGKERLSRYAFGELLCAVWGFDTTLLQPTRRAALPFKAARPADTFMTSERAWTWGYSSITIEEQLNAIKESMESHL